MGLKVKEIIKKLCKYSILLSIKESYLFSRNIFGLVFHPFKTLRTIQREKDYSQAFLIFGLPFYIFIAGIILIISLRFLINASAAWGSLAKISLFLVFSFSFLVFVYLGYWFFKIKKIKNEF